MAGQGPAAQPAAVAVLVGADHLEEPGIGSGRIRGLKNPEGSRRELDAVALVKVPGRAATKGIGRIDAGLAGHDQGASGMDLAQAVVREARARASRPARRRPCWRSAAAGRGCGRGAASPPASETGNPPHRGCWGSAQRLEGGGERGALCAEAANGAKGCVVSEAQPSGKERYANEAAKRLYRATVRQTCWRGCGTDGAACST